VCARSIWKRAVYRCSEAIRRRAGPTRSTTCPRPGSARELPAEGAGAVVDAASRLARIQERKNDTILWSSIQELLDDPNPVLVDAALELVIKFRRESVELLPAASPLLASPRPDIRRRAALIIGRVLAKPDTASLPERGALIGELTSRARRDDDPAVRQTATAALALLPDMGIDETLRTIGQDDPDQNVRFEAEKALYERKQSAALRRSD
jgi:HEAT repeat protein